MGKQQDWCGYEVSLDEWSVGLTKSKQEVLSSSIRDIMTGGDNIPFCDLQKLTSRMAWWGVAFPLVKPFLRNAFRCLGRMEEVGKKKLKGCFDEDTGAILPGKRMVVARAKARWFVKSEVLGADVEVWMRLVKGQPTWKPKRLAKDDDLISIRVDAMGDEKFAGIGGFVSLSGFDRRTVPDLKDVWWFSLAWQAGQAPVPELDVKQPRRMISALEGVALLVGLRILLDKKGEDAKHKRVLAETDSMVCALVSGSWRTRSALLQRVFKEIAIECISNDVVFQAIHIPGEMNVQADALSRMDRFPKHRSVVELFDNDQREVPQLGASFWLQDSKWDLN